MKDVNLLIVNYHYIRKISQQRGIYSIRPEIFNEQLDEINKNKYKFISIEMLNNSIINKDVSKLPNKCCLITFDDGLKESYEMGLDILNKKGIPGMFYINTDPIINHTVSDVHKLQYILSKTPINKLLKKLNNKTNIKESILKEQYPWDNIEVAKFKYVLNFILTNKQKKEFLKKTFDIIYNEKDYSQNLYMNNKQIKILSKRNYLGTHGNQHVPLSTLNKEELNDNIKDSIKDIKMLTGKTVKSISYPYGGKTSINEKVIETVKNNGLISGMTMERGINNSKQILNNPLMLKRFDTNDIYIGKDYKKYKHLL